MTEHLKIRGIEQFLPLYCSASRWKDGRVVNRKLPLFSSYVFVHICRKERASVLSVPGVLTIVGAAGKPTPLSSAEIESLRNGLQWYRITPHPFLTIGQKARIRRGPLAGMEGIVSREKNRTRLVLSIDLIQRSIAVEVEVCDVEPV